MQRLRIIIEGFICWTEWADERNVCFYKDIGLIFSRYHNIEFFVDGIVAREC